MKLIVAFLLIAMTTTVLSCSTWYQGASCYCACEDAAIACKQLCKPVFVEPVDAKVRVICSDTCNVDSILCMRGCVH
ncbi:hypothetical protein KP79_PYT22775 [Mizuhopecten yessoensis]|uniref:Uncharacterized protein n=1 Tax=Mizuhopecten yessoensis TaxID=6573 RepID=A0A210QPF8_MIZYE|nr:hypothetical protein KP79_PYT22775 [Mizuhopecten yessoensis]